VLKPPRAAADGWFEVIIMESIAPGPKSSDPSSESTATEQNTRKAPKNTRKAPKKTQKAPKNTRKAPKNTPKARQNARAPRQHTGAAPKDASHAAHDVLVAERDDGATSDDKPKVRRIRLVAPSRTGRSVTDLQLALTRAEVRLELAWRHRATLDVALPQSPPFHDHAWSAMAALRGEVGAGEDVSGDGSGGAAPALEALFGALTTLRNVVEYTTRPGDPAREALRFGTTLRTTASLLEVAPAVIAGARSVQGRFPALTDESLAEAEAALAVARAKVQGSRREVVDGAVDRIDGADAQQLALDVLLDCIDHLRAAARSRLHKTRPRLCEALCAPIDRTKTRAATEPEADGGEKKDDGAEGGEKGDPA
jgi:hypothetical protein